MPRGCTRLALVAVLALACGCARVGFREGPAAGKPAVWIDERGCFRVGGAPFFLVELYNLRSVEELEEAASSGFNAAVVPPSLLDACGRAGMLGLVGGFFHTDRDFDEAGARARVEACRDHPALFGYVLADEPDLRWWDATPEGLAAAAAVVRAADSRHPVLVTCSGGAGSLRAADYADAVDAMRLDPYPFLFGKPLAWAMEVVDETLLRHPLRPVILIQQGWTDREDLPSPQEHRCLAWLGLVHGVRGLSVYAYRFSDRGTPELLKDASPALWEAVCTVARQARQLAPFLLPDGTPAPEVALSGEADGVEAGAFATRAGCVLLLCNTSAEERRPRLRLRPAPDDLVPLFGSPEPSHELCVVLPPLGVAAYRWVGPLPEPEGWEVRAELSLGDSERVPVRVFAPGQAAVVLRWRAGRFGEGSRPVRLPAGETRLLLRIPCGLRRAVREGGGLELSVEAGGEVLASRIHSYADELTAAAAAAWPSPVPTRHPPIPRMTPVVDGDASEWEGVRRFAPTRCLAAWGEAALAWDEQALYVLCRYADATPVEPPAAGAWRGDSLQLGVDAGPWPLRQKEGGDPGYIEAAVAARAGGGVLVEVGNCPRGAVPEEIAARIVAAVRTAGDVTTYEVAVPWAVLGRRPPVVAVGLLVNDWLEPGGRRTWLEWGGGIVGMKDPSVFLRFALE